MPKFQNVVLLLSTMTSCLLFSALGVAQTTVTPTALAFGNVVVGETSSVSKVTLKNTGSAAITISSYSVPAGSEYAVSVGASSTCANPGGLAAGASCTIGMTLTPSSLGAATGTLTITTTAGNNTVSLTGTGIAPTTLSATTLAFGNVVINETSAIKTVSLKNNQLTALSITSLTLPVGSPFAIDPSTTCANPGALAAGATCKIGVTLTPTTTGPQNGTLTINTNASNTPQFVTLTGTEIAPTTLSATSLAFGNVTINETSAIKTISLTNNQLIALNITSLALTAGSPFAIDPSTTCGNPGTLAAGATCKIGVTLTPTTIGPQTGTLTINTNASNTPQLVTLTGTEIAPTTLSATTLAFGNVAINESSAIRTVSLTNNQLIALNITSLALTAGSPFAIDPSTTCASPGTLAAGATCKIAVTLTPPSLGVQPAAMLTITTNAANSPQAVNLTGSGVVDVSLPATLSFGNVVLGQTALKTATLTNNQLIPLTISSITGFSGGYALNAASTTCPLSPNTLAGTKTCVIAINLTAVALGAQPGAITVNYSAAGSPQSMTLSANAIPQVELSPTSLAFAAQFVGTTSAAKMVTVTNEQNIPLTINSVSISGANASDFGVTSTCPIAPATLLANKNCPLSVTFTPSGTGTRTATLSVTDSATTGSPQALVLTGSGNAPVTIAPTSITTFTAPVGTTSAYKNITITNSDTVIPLVINSLQLNGDFIQSATTCPLAPASLAGGKSCTVSVEFNPSIGGIRSGQLEISDNVATSPQVVNLSGTGTSPLTVSPTSLSFSAQTVGTTSTAKTITLTNHETQLETFSLATTGDYAANTNCPTGVIAGGASCLIFVDFAPSSATPATRSGTLTITNSAASGAAAAGASPISVPLTGSATTTNPAPAVSVVSPGAGAAGTVVNVVITGNGWTHFRSSSVISFVDTASSTYASDITVTSQTAVSANQINATLSLTGTGAVFGARNITVVSPLSGGGSETAKLLSAFIIADPNQTHSITAVTPALGSQGQTLDLALSASGTHFLQGTTFANFGDGITVNSLTITDGTDAQASITISNTTPVGYRTITLVTGGEIATSVLSTQGNPIFQILPNSAALLGISPNLEPQSFAGPVTITATGTHFLQNATQVSIGGVIVGNVTVTSATSLTAQLAVPAAAPLGPQNVTVSTGGEIASLNNAFTITGSTPALLSVTPSSGVQGQSLNVVITGNAYTNFVAGQISAEFDGNIPTGAITVNSANQVTIPITISSVANVGSITANLLSGPSGNVTLFPFTFTVTPSSASILGVVPNSVPQGGQVTINVTGSNTIWNQADTTATFYPATVPTPSVNEVTINSPTSAALAISVPTNTPPGTYGFYMATGGQVVSSSITVYANTPTLTMSPANGLLPAISALNSFSASFTGQFTNFNATTLPVIAGEGVTLSNFKVNSPVSATATVTIIGGVNGTPTATGSRLVTFTTGGQIVTTNFNVTRTPVGILSVSPYHGPQSTTMNVEIIGLNTHFTAGTTQVLFGPQITVNSVTVNTPTDLIANITTSFTDNNILLPSPAGWQSIYVNTGVEQVIGGFLVDAPASPTLLSVFPASAAQGATVDVLITGSLTSWVQGTTEAILGAGVSVSNLTITSPTTATATIAVSPTAPVGGNSVIMMTGSQVVSGTGFSVTPSAAEIVSVGPAVTCNGNFSDNCGVSGGSGTPWVVGQLQTTTLKIGGVGTHWLQGETMVSFGPGVDIDQLTVTSPTTATVQITVLSTSPVGFASLTTYTDGEVVTLQQAIDIEEGSPTLLAISPGAAQQGATLNVQILGRFTNFNQAATSAAFNLEFPSDIVVNSINVIDSQTMVANVTVSPLSYVDTSYPCGHTLTITTGSEQVGGLPTNFCIAQGAEEITNVYPLQGNQGTSLPVTITGSATNFAQGVTQVSFGDPNFQVGQITVNSPTSLTVPVAITTSATNGFKTVTVSTLGQVASQQYSFSVTPTAAMLTEAIPNQAEQGVQNLNVHLVGQYSHFSALSTATFGAGITVNSVSFTDLTDLVANINIDPLSFAGSRTVTVTTPGVSCSYQPPVGTSGVTYPGCTPGSPNGTGSEIVTASVFSIIPGPAIITNVSPATGNEGQEVVFTITGSATHWAQNFTQFYIAGGGSDLTINSVVINSATSATVDLSISPTANTGARSIYMVTNGESLTDSGAFVVTGGIPVITYLSPNATQNNPTTGTTGLEVKIHGLYTNWVAGTTTVNFGPGITVASFQVDDATHIEALINIAANAQVGYRTVVVPTGAQALAGNFLVQAPAPPPSPYIWYISPGSGLPGQTFTVTFNGVNTQWNPGTGPACGQTGTTLTGFDNNVTVNCFQVTSPTTATANITINSAAPAKGYDLTLTTTGTTNNPSTEVDSAQFSVVIAQPTLTIVDPGSGLQGAQNITVNILGQYTTFDATTTFQFGSGVTTNGPPTILGPTIATQSISINALAPLGGRSVVATTPDAASIAQTVGGAGFTVTPSLALISAVTPNLALQGTTATVEVTGQNTLWNSTTTFSFGAGIVVTSTQVNSNTDATLTISIPALAQEGPTSVSAMTGGEIASLANAFVVQAGTPLLLSTGPGSVPLQGSVVFTILSQATSWSAANPPTVSYGPAIVLTNTTVTSPTSLTVDGYVLPTANSGYYNLTVTSGTQVLGIQNAVYVSSGPAVVNSLSPASGGQGVNLPAVQITGANTHWQQGLTYLTFPGAAVNSLTINSPTSATANITISTAATPGQVSVTMTTLGEIATEVNAFQIIETEPELLFIDPSMAAQGVTTTLSITAVNTHFGATTTATFGPGVTVNSLNAASLTSLQANVTVQPTATLGARTATITTGTEVASNAGLFQVTVGPAAILSLSPASGGQGSSLNVLVTGSQTNFSQGITTASFGPNISINSVMVSDSLHATVNISISGSATLGAQTVMLTTGGEVATIPGGFTITNGTPQIMTVNPASGHQGDTGDSIILTGQSTHWVQGTTTASFGAGITVTSLTVSSLTSATAMVSINAAAAIGGRTVTLTTGSEVANSANNAFQVQAGVPAVTFAPNSANAGSNPTITLNGAFTSFASGVTTVNFGSNITTGAVTVNGPTQASVPIQIGINATLGNRTVTITTGSQVVQATFVVTVGAPTITLVSPNTGIPGASNLSVTLNGSFTSWVNQTTVASFGAGISVGGGAVGAAGPVTVSNSGSLTASLTIQSNAALGPRNVVVTTGAEQETAMSGFTVLNCSTTAPSVYEISPFYGSTNAPLNAKMQMQFTAPLNRATIDNTDFVLYDTTTGQYLPGTVTVDASGRIATLTPNALLAVGREYYLYLENLGNTVPTDTCGNTINTGYYYFTTQYSAETSGPALVSSSPVSGDTNDPLNTNVVLQFSSTINQLTQPAGVTVTSGGTAVPGTYNFSPDRTQITFVPGSTLLPATSYTVTLTAALQDEAGNALTNPNSINFTTGSATQTTNGSITSANPYYGATGVGTNVTPTVYFSTIVDPLTVGTGNFYLVDPNTGHTIPATVAVAANRLKATLTPAQPLQSNTQYYFSVAASSNCNYGPCDLAGNYISGGTWYFTTGSGPDTSAPGITISPANNTTGVPVNVQITAVASSPLNPQSVTSSSISVKSGGTVVPGTVTPSGYETVTFAPAANLSPSTSYTVTVSGLQDEVGNTVPTATSTFTTSASGTPVTGSFGLSSVTPAYGATGVVNTTPIVITFANVINPETITNVPVWDGSIGRVGVSGTWSVNGATATFTPTTPYPANASIYVCTCDAVQDLAGNTVSAYYATIFTVANTPTVAPLTVTSITPTNGATGVGRNAAIAVTFSASVNPSTVNANSVQVFSGSTNLYAGAISFSSNYRTIFFTPTTPANQAITVVLTAAITDISGNALTPFQSIYTTAPDVPSNGPSVTVMLPGNGATDIPQNSVVTLYTSGGPLNPATLSGGLFVSQNGVLIQGTTVLTSNGQAIQFTPASPLAYGGLIQVNATGAIQDTYGNALAAFSGQFTVQSNPSGTGPKLIVVSPVSYASNVPLNVVPQAEFDQVLLSSSVNSNNVQLQDGCTGGYVAGTVTLTGPGNNVVQFTPQSPLTALCNGSARYYYFYINEQGGGTPNVTNVDGVSAQAVYYYFYMGATSATAPPTVTGVSPTNGTSNVGVNAGITLTFSGPIDPISVNASTIQVTGASQTAVPVSISFNSTDTVATFTPQSALPSNATINVKVSGVTDTAGNVVPNFSSSFNTAAGPDFTRPTVINTSPTANQTGVPTNLAIVIQFSKPIAIDTVNTSDFYLYDTFTGAYPAASVSVASNGLSATLNPTAALAIDRVYYFYASSGITDLVGNPLQSSTTYFTTATTPSSTSPQVLTVNPANGLTGIATNVVLNIGFSEPIAPTSLGQITLAGGGTSIPLTPSLATGNQLLYLTPNTLLTPDTVYTLTVSAVQDNAGNNMPQPFVASFTTAASSDLTSGSVTSIDPYYGATGIATNVKPTVHFSRQVDPLSVSTSYFYLQDYYSGRTIPATISVAANQLSATLTPVQALQPNTYFYVHAYSFTDVTGNSMSGLGSYFTTGTGPAATGATVSSLSPPAGATGAPVNTQVVAVMSGPIDPTSVGPNAITVTGPGNTPVAGTVTLASDLVTLAFVPSASLAVSTTYSIKVAGFNDQNGNPIVVSNTVFTTGASAVPQPAGSLTLVSVTPPNGVTLTSNTTPVVITFSNPINPATVNNIQVWDNSNQNAIIAGTWAVNGAVATFTPLSPYPANSLIFVYTEYAVQDFAGNTDNIGYATRFTAAATADTTAPTVTSVTPANAATGVGTSLTVVLTFSKALNPSTVNATNITALAGDKVLSVSPSLSANGRTVTFSESDLPGNQTITIAATSGVQDLSGNSLTYFQSHFTTLTVIPSQNSGPSVNSQVPTNGATDVPQSSTLTLFVSGSPLSAASVSGAIHVAVNGAAISGSAQLRDTNSIVFTPASPWPYSALIQVFVDTTLVDVNGNPLTASYSGQFTVQGNPLTAKPAVVAVSPVYYTSGVPLNIIPQAEYDQALNPASANSNNVQLYNPCTGLYVPGTVSVIGSGNNVVQFSPQAALSASCPDYYFQINEAGSNLTNADGVAAAAVNYYFYVGSASDTTTPTVVAIGPPNGAAGVGTNASIFVRFSKVIDALSVTGSTISISGGSQTVTPASITVDSTGTLITISPLDPLPASTAMTIAINGVTDQEGHAVTSASSTFTTAAGPNFSTPTAVAYGPAYYDTVPSNTTAFTIQFNEPLDPLSVTPANFYVYSYYSGQYTYGNSISVSADKKSYTLNVPALTPGNYYYQLNGAWDQVGNRTGAPYAYFTVSTTADTTPPTVIQVSPIANVTGVPTNAPVNILFSKEILMTSLGSVQLLQSGVAVPVTINTSGVNTIVSLTPNVPLLPNTVYTISVTNVMDVQGNSMASAYTSSFTTGVGIDLAPLATLVSSTPANGASNVPDSSTLSLVFSGTIDPTSFFGSNYAYWLYDQTAGLYVPVTITFSANFMTVTFAPNATLTSGHYYRFAYSYVNDVAGNSIYVPPIYFTAQ